MRVRFVDYSELAVFAIGILIVLFLLFPRERLIWLIVHEVEDSNIDLSVIYMENLLSVKPDEVLKFYLAKKYISLARYDKAEQVLRELSRSRRQDIRHAASVLRYSVLKRRYFEGQKELRAEIERELKRHIIDARDIRSLRNIYRESLSMDMPQVALLAALKLSVVDKAKVYWLKEAYKQALATEERGVALDLLQRLAEKDHNRRKHWLKEGFRLAMEIRDYGRATYYLEQLGRYGRDSNWYRQRAELYLIDGDHRGAIDAYERAMKLERSKSLRYRYFKKAVDVALWNDDYEEVKRLIGRYAAPFLDHDDRAEYILRAALATGDMAFADRLARQLLERMR